MILRLWGVEFGKSLSLLFSATLILPLDSWWHKEKVRVKEITEEYQLLRAWQVGNLGKTQKDNHQKIMRKLRSHGS